MKVHDYFNLGCKLFGVYFISLSIPLFIAAFATFYPPNEIPNGVEKYFTFYVLITRLLPIIYVFLGYQLIRNSEKFIRFAYKGSEDTELSGNRPKFQLFLKMIGIHLFAKYLPEFIKSITSYLTYSNAPTVLGLLTMKQFTSRNFVPSLVAVVFGIYLFMDGKLIVDLGFKNDIKE